MKTYKIEMTLNLDDDTTCVDWIFKAIQEQLEDGEELVSGRFKEEGYTNESTDVKTKLKEFFESQDPIKLAEALR